MNIRRKVTAVAGSALMLSSLFAVVAAPTAVGAVAVTGAGNVAAGGTSAGTTVISFTENSAAAFAAVPVNPSLLVTITDSAGGNTVHFVGTPVLTAQGNTALPPPGSLGATATLQSAGATNNQLRINFAGSDTSTVEKFDVTGLSISADAAAATGGVIATVTGSQAGAVLPTTALATGVNQSLPVVLVGSTTATFTVTSTCGFRNNVGVTPDGNAGALTFNDGVLSESVNVSTASATPVSAVGSTQVLTFATGTVNGHAPGTAASQTVSNCSGIVGSPANVVNGAGQTSTVTQVGNNPVTVNPGEQNQPAGSTTITENAPGVVKAGSITYTLSQPATGSVLFSTSPAVLTTTNTTPIPPPTLTATAVAPPGSCAAGTFFYAVEAVYAGPTHTDPSGIVTATTTTAGSAYTVTWTAAAGPVVGYNVFRSATGAPGSFQLVGPASPTVGAVTTYTDTCTGTYGVAGALPANNSVLNNPTSPVVTPLTTGGTTFAVGNCTYSLTAYNGPGNETTAPAGVTVAYTTPTSSATITWTAVAGATGYILYRSGTAGCPTPGPTPGAFPAGPVSPGDHAVLGNVTSATDIGPSVGGVNWVTGGTYTFLPFPGYTAPTNPAVAATNASTLAAGTYFYKGTSRLGTGEGLPSAGTSATIVAGGSITLTWPAVTGATGYKIYGRPAVIGGVYGLIGTTAALTFTDNGSVVPGAVPPTTDTTVGVAPTVGTVCNLSPDRKSCTVGVGAAGSNQPSTITLGAIALDVSSDATVGTPVNVTVTGSPAFIVLVSSQTIAYIARLVIGIADQPTIFINYNDQITGTVKLTESAPGYFNAGVGGNNAVGLCLVTGETFTRAPWIIVTSGDTKLNDGAGNPVSQVAGTLYTAAGNSCVRWTIYSASTTASTIEIRGSDSTGAILPAGLDSGPRLSVGPGLRPGTTQAVVLVGSQANVLVGALFPPATSPAFSKLVSLATRAYKSGVSVSVVGTPPFLPLGSDPLAANISIKESLNGQFKAGDVIVVQILPRSTRLRSDVLMNTGSTNQLPIITTNSSSGLLVGPVTFPGAPVVNCQPAVPAVSVCAFAFAITQQAFGSALGEITISNMDYIVAPDAALGPVQVNVFSIPLGNVGLGGGVLFNQVVTNAIVGDAPLPPALTKTSATSAITKTQAASAFTVGTKVVHLGALAGNPNNIVTIRIKVDPSLVGKTVQIQRATKSSSGVWGAWSTLTSRVVGSDGYAYYYASAHSAQWQSYRGSFAGNAQWAASHSQTVQVRWL